MYQFIVFDRHGLSNNTMCANYRTSIYISNSETNHMGMKTFKGMQEIKKNAQDKDSAL